MTSPAPALTDTLTAPARLDCPDCDRNLDAIRAARAVRDWDRLAVLDDDQWNHLLARHLVKLS